MKQSVISIDEGTIIMAIFKCKMCGGALEINNNETVAICEYCGTQQTLPKLDDERRANLYDRANHFRRNNEFDKAMGIYEQILNEDNNDAEAFWSLVLCRYGIEYVEDPYSHKRIPTVNRAQFTSVFDDDNYKSALQYADGYQRIIYEEEAKAINEIQKGILAISQKEEPFDVFICYKETDNNGRRTPDSVLANDLYHQLTQEGFKVFFARITLEDKLGSAYEPYIFAALNSAKVMVALGTKPEYFNAVWVKNEWSRYLSIIKNGAKKMLIPAYKDMDPYDLPEEFSHLQAQDMSKLGFMQDLIRGIKKIVDAQTPKATIVNESVISNSNANTAPLLKRAFLFLEDEEWDSADEYCEKVLDIDPECAEAYLGKLMAELKVPTRQKLKNQTSFFDGHNNYQKAMRFGDENLKKELQGYTDYIENRNLTTAYNRAVKAMNSAKTDADFRSASKLFKDLGNFKDSKELETKCIQLASECFERKKQEIIERDYTEAVVAMEGANTEKEFKNAANKFTLLRSYKDCEERTKLCLENAKIARKDEIYNSAVALMETATIASLKNAIDQLKTIEDWKDSANKIYDCERIIYDLEQKAEADRIEAERLAEEKRLEEERIAEERRIEEERIRIEKEKRARHNRKVATIILSSVAVVAIFLVALFKLIIPESNYGKATELMTNGNYLEASEIFKKLGDYKDSSEKSIESLYQQGLVHWNAKQFDDSNKIFEGIIDYKDSKDKIHSHEYTSKITKNATCAEEGVTTFACKTCDSSYTEPIKLLAHEYTSKTTKNATCAEEGVTTFACKTCDSSYTEPIKLLAHNYTEKIVSKPTCTEAGKKTLTCSSCKQIKEESIKATEHSYKETIIKAATCSTSGSKKLTCHCGDTRTETIKMIAHNYSAATCTSPQKCKACGATSGSTAAHNYSAATCTSPKKCKTCGATSGSTAAHNYLEATCTTAKKCKTCGATSGSALGHTTTTGKCSRCNYNFTKPIVYHGNFPGDWYFLHDKRISDVGVPAGNYKITVTATHIGDADFVLEMDDGTTPDYGWFILKTSGGTTIVKFKFTSNDTQTQTVYINSNKGFDVRACFGSFKLVIEPVN